MTYFAPPESYPIVRGRIKLLKMATSEEQIVTYLKALGIKGHRCTPKACPVSEYLRKDESLVLTEVTCDKYQTWCYEQGTCRKLIIEEGVWNNAAVTNFVLNFDMGNYPALDVNGWMQPPTMSRFDWKLNYG